MWSSKKVTQFLEGKKKKNIRWSKRWKKRLLLVSIVEWIQFQEREYKVRDLKNQVLLKRKKKQWLQGDIKWSVLYVLVSVRGKNLFHVF